jgi:hypothetical protein
MRRRKPGPLSTGRDEVACQEVRPEARPGAHAELPLKLGARIDAQSTLRSNRLGTPGVSWLLRHSGSCRLRSRRRLEERRGAIGTVTPPCPRQTSRRLVSARETYRASLVCEVAYRATTRVVLARFHVF